MATQEVVKCDACKKQIQPGQSTFQFYVTESRVPDQKVPKATDRRMRYRRFHREREAEVDVCSEPACMAVIPSLVARAFRRVPVRVKRKGRKLKVSK